jgi:hypothetical protein
VTASLLFVNVRNKARALHRTRFNQYVWRPALTAAGVSDARTACRRADHDPSFTLRTYTHLMPNSEARTRAAVDRVFRDPDSTGDGPETAPGAS